MKMLCPECGCEFEVLMNAIKVRYGCYDGYFIGDLMYCPSCKMQVAVIGDEEVFDPEAEVHLDLR